MSGFTALFVAAGHSHPDELHSHPAELRRFSPQTEGQFPWLFVWDGRNQRCSASATAPLHRCRMHAAWPPSPPRFPRRIREQPSSCVAALQHVQPVSCRSAHRARTGCGAGDAAACGRLAAQQRPASEPP